MYGGGRLEVVLICDILPAARIARSFDRRRCHRVLVLCCPPAAALQAGHHPADAPLRKMRVHFGDKKRGLPARAPLTVDVLVCVSVLFQISRCIVTRVTVVYLNKWVTQARE